MAFVIMVCNAVIYLNSLFFWQNGTRPERKMPVNSSIRSYLISLHTLGDDGQTGALIFEQQGDGDPPDVITIDGYSHSIAIPLDTYWDEIRQQRLEVFFADLTTRETIIKFGETMQLVNDYRIVILAGYTPGLQVAAPALK